MKKNIIFLLIEIILKLLISYLSKCYTLAASTLFDLLFLTSLLFSKEKKTNNINKIITILIALIYSISGIALAYVCLTNNNSKLSLWIIPFTIIILIIKYCISCLDINNTYNKRNGLLMTSYSKSNYDFFASILLILLVIISKIGHWFPFLLYIDKVGTIIYILLFIKKMLSLIKESFSNKISNIDNEIKEEILKRTEVTKINSIQIYKNGGLRYISIQFSLKENLDMLTITNFSLTLNDYLLKYADCGITYLSPNQNRKNKRSVINARNSRSGNSKTNTKRKNTKQKNKKH